MSLHNARFFRRLPALVSAAVLVHAGSAIAADSAGDIQQQVKDVLTGTSTTYSPRAEVSYHEAVRPTADVQDFAKRLLLGTTTSPAATAEQNHSVSAQADTHSDIQANVRVFLRGESRVGAGS
jgi:hypothetical protein